MKNKRIFAFLMAFSLVFSAFGAGFGLYEMDAYTSGVGTHGVALDRGPSANYYNPAGLSSLTGTWFSVGLSCLNPNYDSTVNGKSTSKMNSGFFCVPNVFLSQELPGGFTFGLGLYADYGLGSHYDNHWPISWNSVAAKFEGCTCNPNLAYRINDDWSIAAGVRLVHMAVSMRRNYFFDRMYTPGMDLGLGRMGMKLRVENDVDVGYVLGTQYRVNDSLRLGAVYRTRVRADLEGDSMAKGSGRIGAAQAKVTNGSIKENLDLPSSATFGFDWNVTKPLHMVGSLIWTEWSTVEELKFKLPSGMQRIDLRWHDAWRTGFGFSYDVTENWMGMVGYCYDWDPSREKRPITMLPAGDRHIVSFGCGYHRGSWEIAANYSLIIMESKTMNFAYANAVTGDMVNQRMKTDNSFTHCVGLTLTYHF